MKQSKTLRWVVITLAVLLFSLGPARLISQSQAQQEYQVYLPVIFKAPYAPEKGLVLPSAYTYCADLDTLNVGWYFRNSGAPAADCPVPDRRFVPRLGNASIVTTTLISSAISSGQASGWIIGFTEPNINYWDGYVSPREGAIAWRQIENQALPAGIKLVSPSPSQHDPGGLGGAATDGYTWIWKMIDEYEKLYGSDPDPARRKPHFDALGWNYYENEPAKFRTFLNARRQEALARGYNVPFWILEYAGECWNTGRYPTGNSAVMTEITAFFKDTPWIDRYAWFTNRIKASDPWAPNWHSCSLLNPDTGSKTSLGTLYAGY